MWQLDPSGTMKDRRRFKPYRNGHMMYLRQPDLEPANEDIREFIGWTTPAEGAPGKFDYSVQIYQRRDPRFAACCVQALRTHIIDDPEPKGTFMLRLPPAVDAALHTDFAYVVTIYNIGKSLGTSF